MAAYLDVFKTSVKLHFIQIEFCFRRSSLGDIESDEKKSDLMSTLTLITVPLIFHVCSLRFFITPQRLIQYQNQSRSGKEV